MTDEKYNRLLQAAVPSKDVREYCEKLGRFFAPYELATLICQNSTLSYSQQDTLLAEIIPELKAETNAESKNIGGRYKNSYSSAEVAKEIEDKFHHSQGGGDEFPAKNDRGYDWWTTDGELVLEDPVYCSEVSFSVGSWIDVLDHYTPGE